METIFSVNLDHNLGYCLVSWINHTDADIKENGAVDLLGYSFVYAIDVYRDVPIQEVPDSATRLPFPPMVPLSNPPKRGPTKWIKIQELDAVLDKVPVFKNGSSYQQQLNRDWSSLTWNTVENLTPRHTRYYTYEEVADLPLWTFWNIKAIVIWLTMIRLKAIGEDPVAYYRVDEMPSCERLLYHLLQNSLSKQ